MKDEQKKSLLDWIQFFSIYKHLLTGEQMESYMAMMIAGDPAPAQLTMEDLEPWERSVLRRHMGKVIRKYRENKGLEQKQLADMLGRGAAFVSLVESGEKALPSTDLFQVTMLLNIPPVELFTIPILG